jgi:hypothetical protein
MEKNHKENRKKEITKARTKSPLVHSVDTQPKDNVNKLKCVYTNADSLSNKMTELKTIAIIEKPHVIAVTEVKPKNYRDITLEDFTLEGYETHSLNVTSRVGRGIIIYTHESVRANDIEILVEYDEACWMEIKLDKGDKLLIGCLYRSDSGTQENNNKLLDIIKHAMSLDYSHYLFMGDFNYNSICWDNWTTTKSENSNEFLFIECIRDQFLFQHVNRPTRARADAQPSTIDLIFTNEENMLSDIRYCSPLGRSDHAVLIFEFQCYIHTDSVPRMKYSYDKGDFTSMNRDMNIDWPDYFKECTDDVTMQWNIFKYKLLQVQDKHIPHHLDSGQPKWRSKGKIHVDINLRKEIHKKHRAWESVYTKKTDEAKKLYNRQRNKVRKLTRKLHRDYEKNIAKEAKVNPKRFWQYAKSKTKTNCKVAQLVMPSEEPETEVLTSNDSDKAEVLLNYFSSVFTQEPDGPIPTLEDKITDESLAKAEFSEKQVMDKLLDLNVNKSAGPDEIHPRILRELARSIASPLTIIFNTSARTQVLPADWKLGNITAIFKKGKKNLPSNYRPISLTSIVCKILESLMRERITRHFARNNLFSRKQFGFLSGRSTVLQLLHVLDDWSKILDEGGTIDCVYMDFMKAFDTVPHKRLLEKIRSYGITDQVLGWISSFLTDRQQRVCINGKHSKWGTVTSGIPQGSVLGPVLFVIYINDLPDVIRHSSAFLFADDTKVYKRITCVDDSNGLQSDLMALQEWTDKWLIKFHPDKCVVLTVGTDTQATEHLYYLKSGNNVHNLKYVEHEKDLGITMDRRLNFDKHIQEKVNKANSMMGLIRRTFCHLDEENFKLLYKAFVRPHLEYGNVIWHPHRVEHIVAIENVQRRATKLIPSLRDLPYEERLKHLHLPSLAYRRLRGDMIETYKLFNIYDRDVAMTLDRNTSTTRGHQYKLSTHRFKKDVGKYTFSTRVVNPWNSLTDHIVDSKNLKVFEARLDKYWSSEELLYNHRASPPGANRKLEPNLEA